MSGSIRRTGGEVLWVEPYPTRLPGLSDLSRGNDKVGQVEGSQVPPWLEVVRSRALPIEPLPLIRRFNRLLFRSIVSNCVKFARTERDCLIVFDGSSDLALAALDELSNCPSAYDAMDDFPAFYDGLSRISMHSRERAVVERVSVSWFRPAIQWSVLQERIGIFAWFSMHAMNRRCLNPRAGRMRTELA